jgi:hypothetical protein
VSSAALLFCAKAPPLDNPKQMKIASTAKAIVR